MAINMKADAMSSGVIIDKACIKFSGLAAGTIGLA